MNNFSLAFLKTDKATSEFFFCFFSGQSDYRAHVKTVPSQPFPPLIIFLLAWIKMQEGTVLSTGEGGEVQDGEEGMFPGPLPEHWWSVEVKR